MSALVFRLREEPDQRLDLSGLVPASLQGRDEKSIARLPVHTVRHKLNVGDVFAIRMGEAGSLRFQGGSERFDFVGAGMSAGEIVVEGSVGQQAGRLMGGGRLHIKGDAGPFAASRLVGGLIEIDGNAGDNFGGPLAGEMAGMAGGVAISHGNVGARAGDRLRRGLIVIEGRSGVDAGSRMIAGTLVLGGTTAGPPGALMRRGTIVLTAPDSPISPTFVDCGVHRLVVARLLAGELATLGCGLARKLGRPMRRFAGDNAALGKGEILAVEIG
jgi:formylmethanofuran dehydrogenase subunit C